MDMLERNKSEKKYKEHLDKLVEPSLVVYSPDDYNQIDFCLQKNIPYWQFVDRPLDERAKIMATAILSGMCQIINRSAQIVDENKKKIAEKASNNTKRK